MSLNRNFEVTDLRNYIEYHQLLPEPIILYVLGGDAVVDINLRATELHADSMIYTTGASVMHLEQASADFRAAIITVSSNQFAEMATRHCYVAIQLLIARYRRANRRRVAVQRALGYDHYG